MAHSARGGSLASRTLSHGLPAAGTDRDAAPAQSQRAMADKAEFVVCESTIWKRFWRLSRAGVFEAFFEALAGASHTAHLVQMFDSTVVRAHVSAAGAKGGRTGKLAGASS
jgi:transposase